MNSRFSSSEIAWIFSCCTACPEFSAVCFKCEMVLFYVLIYKGIKWLGLD